MKFVAVLIALLGVAALGNCIPAPGPEANPEPQVAPTPNLQCGGGN